MVKRWVAAVMVALFVTGGAAGEANAQQDAVSFGLRTGVTIAPDGFVVGAFANFPLGGFEHFSIEPQALIGFGDLSTLEAGARLRFDFVTDEIDAQPFVLGGLALHRVSFSSSPTADLIAGGGASAARTFQSFGNASDTDISLQIGGGLEKGAIGGEIVLGVASRPDLAVLFRYKFGRR